VTTGQFIDFVQYRAMNAVIKAFLISLDFVEDCYLVGRKKKMDTSTFVLLMVFCVGWLICHKD
jgi:hypothetical protein